MSAKQLEDAMAGNSLVSLLAFPLAVIASSKVFNHDMFCKRCQDFWAEAIAIAHVPKIIESCQNVRWLPHTSTLHHSIRQLRQSFELRCRLCRIISTTPTTWEYESLLKDQDEPIDIILVLDPNNGPHPVLSVEFREGNGIARGIRIAKRMVASCSGLLTEGEDSLNTLMYSR
jgi:hypothetical protein